MALVRTDVSEKIIASIIRVERISEKGKTLLITANVVHRSVILFTTVKISNLT
jgi:uncharacterized protein YpiB (UPF0302 family)